MTNMETMVARVGFAGIVWDAAHVPHDLFEVERDGEPTLYGDYFLITDDDEFKLEIGVFGYPGKLDVGNPDPRLRQGFSPAKCRGIELLIRSFFLDPATFLDQFPPPARCVDASFRPNWIICNPFTNAHIKSAGAVRGTDEQGFNLFEIETADGPPLYGAYFYVFPDEEGYDFNIEIGLFGYVDPNNVGNLHPQARKHFKDEEWLTIGELIQGFFLSKPDIFAKRWPQPTRFVGGVTFRPNWIIHEDPETESATRGIAAVRNWAALQLYGTMRMFLTGLRRLRGD